MIPTPKEKAKELFERYYKITWMRYKSRKQEFIGMPKDIAKKCALIAVDEILDNHYGKESSTDYTYWQDVKTEIENLK